MRDYQWLTTALPKLLNKSASVLPVADLIAFGESDLAAALADRRMEQTLEYQTAGELAPLPDDLRDIEALTVDGCEVTYLTQERYDSTPFCSGRPRYYTVSGKSLLFKAREGQQFTIRLRYLRGLCSLSSSNRTDWLQCQRPAARLYAAAVHAAPYLEDDARLPTWERMRDTEIAAIQSNYIRTPTKLRADAMFNQRAEDVTWL